MQVLMAEEPLPVKNTRSISTPRILRRFTRPQIAQEHLQYPHHHRMLGRVKYGLFQTAEKKVREISVRRIKDKIRHALHGTPYPVLVLLQQRGELDYERVHESRLPSVLGMRRVGRSTNVALLLWRRANRHPLRHVVEWNSGELGGEREE
jgi:hypothetical protein